jgi:hypothetical protein
MKKIITQNQFSLKAQVGAYRTTEALAKGGEF